MSWITEQLRARDIVDERVLAAMAAVPREMFVLPEDRASAYDDGPLSIGFGQTISQPYVVALMTQELDVAAGMRVLEVGTGSGYQTAVLAAMGAEVFSLEIIPELSARAAEVLARAGYGERVHLRVGTGYDGWRENAPFERIIVTAAPPELPAGLLDQLADGGRLIAPVGSYDQRLLIVDRVGTEFRTRRSIPVRFVKMV
jgi:protein-L-isoaspartate(D-aspartate) O-methyltransferase